MCRDRDMLFTIFVRIANTTGFLLFNYLNKYFYLRFCLFNHDHFELNYFNVPYFGQTFNIYLNVCNNSDAIVSWNSNQQELKRYGKVFDCYTTLKFLYCPKSIKVFCFFYPSKSNTLVMYCCWTFNYFSQPKQPLSAVRSYSSPYDV